MLAVLPISGSPSTRSGCLRAWRRCWATEGAPGACLKGTASRLAEAMAGADVGTWEIDLETGHVERNAPWALGYATAEIEPTFNTLTDGVQQTETPERGGAAFHSTEQPWVNAALAITFPSARDSCGPLSRAAATQWPLEAGSALSSRYSTSASGGALLEAGGLAAPPAAAPLGARRPGRP